MWYHLIGRGRVVYLEHVVVLGFSHVEAKSTDEDSNLVAGMWYFG